MATAFNLKDFASGLAVKVRGITGLGGGTDEVLPAHTLQDSTGAEILGTKADAKNAASDNTPISLMAVLKQISFSMQALATVFSGGINTNDRKPATGSAPVVLANEDFAAVGATNETAPTSDVAASGLNGRLQRIAQRITSLIALLPTTLGATSTGGSLAVTLPNDQAASVSATFTPGATSHVAGDVNGGAQTFAAMGLSGRIIMITGASLEIDGGTAEATAWRLYLYNVTPPSATADDGAWDLPSGDRASYLGYVDFGTAVDLGSTQWVETQNINKQVKLSGTALFGYLVNITTLTPAAVAHIVTLHAVQL